MSNRYSEHFVVGFSLDLGYHAHIANKNRNILLRIRWFIQKEIQTYAINYPPECQTYYCRDLLDRWDCDTVAILCACPRFGGKCCVANPN
jgi:hypothetical protein